MHLAKHWRLLGFEAARFPRRRSGHPFFEERTRLKNEEEALCDRADELDRQWEQFVIERETWGEYLAVREDVRRAELTEDSDALIADQEAWGDGWAELAARVEKDWAKRQPK